ncbi:hypothetical protein I6F21_26820 [Bradyrhizobium sp. NBAIM03]|uniref:hypothetical protein n=1 Tax=Bradyrhizobium sp. NBAIM03 TaxID=2793816 RepID=UPI001CD2E2ED|nr:hypothetical protein [Bradyrhizobium sp. NBAIM03]MCA1536148.1 hypothetical protein [Bradyrhizobium sp. NBAIM03]
MNFQEWIDKARNLEAEIAAAPSIEKKPLTTVLCRLHLLACEAPIPVLAAYERLSEATLKHLTGRRIETMTRGTHRWTPRSLSPEDWMLSLGSQIRAVDEYLYTTSGTDFGDPDSELDEWRCPSTNMLVVPRPRNLQDSRLAGRPYLKRGILRHRLLPSEVGGLEVVPIRIDLREAGEKSGVAASLFSNLQLFTRETREGNFIAENVTFDDIDETLDNQIEQSMSNGCAGIVWPELTIDQSTRLKICDLLRKRTIASDDEFPLHWLLAGSWHEETDVGYFNRATVLDGYGRVIRSFDKIVPARDEKGRLEDIRSGECIPVLITDSQLIGLAICRDFCDRASMTSPYLTLPVDFFAVPSMGEESTMVAHLNVAAEVQAKTGARALVVQQTDARLASQKELGYVLPLPPSPASISVNSLKSLMKWQFVSE